MNHQWEQFWQLHITVATWQNWPWPMVFLLASWKLEAVCHQLPWLWPWIPDDQIEKKVIAIITIKKGKRQDGSSGRWGPQQPIEWSGKALWRPYVPEGTNRKGEDEVTNDSDSICVLKGFLVYEGTCTCNKRNNFHMLTTWCWCPQAGKNMLATLPKYRWLGLAWVIFLPFNSFILNTDLSKHNNVIMWVNAAYIANKIILRLISSSTKAYICSSFWTGEQAFSQNWKSHNPKCTIAPAQMSNFKVTCKKIKQFSFLSKWVSTGCLEAHLPKSVLRNHLSMLEQFELHKIYIYTKRDFIWLLNTM